MAHKDINDILYNLLTGQLTEDDQQQLDAWLDESPENKQQFDELMNADDFAASYHLYHSIDKNAAWQKFRERIDHTQGSANELGTPKGEQSAGHSSPLTFKNLLHGCLLVWRASCHHSPHAVGRSAHGNGTVGRERQERGCAHHWRTAARRHQHETDVVRQHQCRFYRVSTALNHHAATVAHRPVRNSQLPF